MIWTLIVFGLLFVVLKKYAWPQILGAVEAREKKLEDQIAETARLQEEAKRLVEQNQKALADGRVQATALLAGGQVPVGTGTRRGGGEHQGGAG